jgi:anti-sigma-K factor RskA
MNYQRAELLNPLAAAYALGSLRGRARRRFEKLSAQVGVVQHARHEWEDRLLPIALALMPVAPRPEVLGKIHAQLRLPATASTPPTESRLSRRWFTFAAAASLLIVAGIVARYSYFNGPSYQPMATLALANTPTWTIERTADNTRVRVRTLAAPTLGAANDYELWLLPTAAGASPVSLGVLPRQGNTEIALNAVQRALAANVTTLAITVEPLGGSPTGLPTGAVVTTAPVTNTG